MNVADLSKVYDKDYFTGAIKSNYTDYQSTAGVLQTLGEMLLHYLPPFQSLFDAGCAYGHLVSHLAKHGIISKGCDGSEFAVAKNPLIYQASIDSIPEADNSYDIVTSFEVLEHLPEEVVPQAISELVRLAKKYVVLTFEIVPTHKTDQPDPRDSTHITMKDYDWWLQKFDGYVLDEELMKALNRDGYSQAMAWSGRFFVVDVEATKGE